MASDLERVVDRGVTKEALSEPTMPTLGEFVIKHEECT